MEAGLRAALSAGRLALFAGLAMWCLFSYLRRLYDDDLALIATAVWSSSLCWMMYADSMHQTALLHATAFLALWGLNYRREPLTARFDFDSGRVTTERVRVLAEHHGWDLELLREAVRKQFVHGFHDIMSEEHVKALTAATPGTRPIALYGGRTQHDLPLHEELDASCDLRVATEDGSRGVRGRVTVLLEQALDELAADRRAPKIYTCGPDRMMAAVAALCAARGVPCEVSLETPMACGYGVCLGCPVPRSTGGYLYACTEGPCIDSARIDWGGSG